MKTTLLLLTAALLAVSACSPDAPKGSVRIAQVATLAVQVDLQFEISADGLSPDLEAIKAALQNSRARVSTEGLTEDVSAARTIQSCSRTPDAIWEHQIVVTMPDGSVLELPVTATAVSRPVEKKTPSTMTVSRLLGGVRYDEERYFSDVDEHGAITPSRPGAAALGNTQTVRYPLPEGLGRGTVVETRTVLRTLSSLEVVQSECGRLFSSGLAW